LKEKPKSFPGLKKKSGARYRLTRWREEQLVEGVKLSYGDPIREYVRLIRLAGALGFMPINAAKRDWLGKESITTRFGRRRRTVSVNAARPGRTYRPELSVSGPRRVRVRVGDITGVVAVGSR
jgi:hypothetical protein